MSPSVKKGQFELLMEMQQFFWKGLTEEKKTVKEKIEWRKFLSCNFILRGCFVSFLPLVKYSTHGYLFQYLYPHLVFFDLSCPSFLHFGFQIYPIVRFN